MGEEDRYLAAGYIGGLGDDGFFLVDLGAAESIDEVIDYHRETIQDPGADEFDSRMQALRRMRPYSGN